MHDVSLGDSWLELSSTFLEMTSGNFTSASLLASVALGSAPAPCAAQQAPAEFSGRFSVGVRSVDVSGAENKFREDINLEDGPRVFDLGFTFTPSDQAMIDRVELDVRNLGGDPFETVRLGVRKYGAFNLKFDRRRSEYFYEDTILPAALASANAATGGDFHHFDFERVQDTLDLDIDLSPAAKLSLGFERMTKSGDSTTTLDIERDEFELEKPLDESLNALTAGFQYAWDKVTLVVEQNIRDYENATQLFLPGFSEGENPGNLTTLSFFFLDQSYDHQSLGHVVRILARPSARFDLNAGWAREDLDLDMNASERSQGTGFGGNPFSTDVAGPATVGRDIERYDFGMRYALSDRLRVVASARHQGLDQQGALSFGSDLGASVWDIETTMLEAGMEIMVTPALTISGGWATETRDTAFERAATGSTLSQRIETERDGFFAGVAFRPSNAIEITASAEDHSVQDPFTLSAPTDGRRYRLSGRYRWNNGLTVTGSYRLNDTKNQISGWTGDSEQTDLRIGYSSNRLQFSAGYGQIELDRNIEQLVTGGSRQDLFPISYAAEARFMDVSVRWIMNDTVALGGSARIYDNDGSFPLQRDDFGTFVEIGLSSGYLLQVHYRNVDSAEDIFDDYRADILELAVGFRW